MRVNHGMNYYVCWFNGTSSLPISIAPPITQLAVCLLLYLGKISILNEPDELTIQRDIWFLTAERVATSSSWRVFHGLLYRTDDWPTFVLLVLFFLCSLPNNLPSPLSPCFCLLESLAVSTNETKSLTGWGMRMSENPVKKNACTDHSWTSWLFIYSYGQTRTITRRGLFYLPHSCAVVN